MMLRKPTAFCALYSLMPVGALLCTLLAAGFAQEPVEKAAKADEKTIRALVLDLGDDSFETREQAQKKLAAIGAPAREALLKVVKETKDVEVRMRGTAVLRDIEFQRFRAMLTEKKWGELVDPEKDCVFRVDKGTLHVKIPPTPHVLSAEIGTVNAPRILRAVEGDFRAEVSVHGAIPADARSLLNGRWPFYASGLLAWQDEGNYIRLERARMFYIPAGIWRCYVGWELRQNGQMQRGGRWEDGLLDAEKPAHFKLDRAGDSFIGSFSMDGKEWKQLPPISAEFTRKLKVGIAAINNTPTAYEAAFENFSMQEKK